MVAGLISENTCLKLQQGLLWCHWMYWACCDPSIAYMYRIIAGDLLVFIWTGYFGAWALLAAGGMLWGLGISELSLCRRPWGLSPEVEGVKAEILVSGCCVVMVALAKCLSSPSLCSPWVMCRRELSNVVLYTMKCGIPWWSIEWTLRLFVMLEGNWHLSQGPGTGWKENVVIIWVRTARNCPFLSESTAMFELQIHLLLLKKNTAAFLLHLLFNSFMLLVGNTIIKFLLGHSLF